MYITPQVAIELRIALRMIVVSLRYSLAMSRLKIDILDYT
jgi:hypothetical protein